MKCARDTAKVRSLATVPAVIAMTIWLFSILCLAFDGQVRFDSESGPASFIGSISFYPDTVTTLLSVIAGAAITTLGLVYSLVLIVFTLAAGNIAPRLLRRFTSDRVNQVTAGLLGGTFLAALTVLHQSTTDFVPAVTVNLVFLLAILSVPQLIYFVHSVSRSVMIDEEISEISRGLEEKLARVIQTAETDGGDAATWLEPDWDAPIKAAENGYITGVGEDALLDLAKNNGLRVELTKRIGDFVLNGQVFARMSAPHPVAANERDRFRDEIRTLATFSSSRGSIDDVEFGLNLLLEIALRALSPGVNDTFTAITCVERLSGTLNQAVREGLRDHVRADDAGIVRLCKPGLSVSEMIDAAFDPLRRAAATNVLMLANLAAALERLHEVAAPDTKGLLEDHGRKLLETFGATNPLETDLNYLKACLGFAGIAPADGAEPVD